MQTAAFIYNIFGAIGLIVFIGQAMVGAWRA
jgi:hypothetical protein